MRVMKSVTVLRRPEQVYEMWRDFENLPRFMYHLEHVENTGARRSHWVARAPGGTTVEWDAEMTEDRPGELIAWRSIGRDDDVKSTGAVRFTPAPGDRGTEVHVDLSYEATGGKIGSMIAKLFGEEPGQQINDDLRRFKQIMEIGEVVRSSASPEGMGQGIMRQQASQPSASETGPDARP